MRRLCSSVVPLLAAALGLAPLASAQPSLPATADPAPTTFAEADDDAPAPPRVVPHRRIVLEPMKEPSDFKPTTDLIVPAASAGVRPAVDLLAPSTVSPGWWSKAIPLRVPVVPSGLPGGTPAVVPASRPTVAGSVAAAPPVRPTPHSTSAVAAGPHVWPSAFLVRKPTEPTETRQAAHFETAPTVPTPTIAEVKRRIEAMYGPKAADFAVATDADGGMVVRLRVHATDADLEKAKVLELLQAAGSGVRVLLEVEP